VVRRSGFTFIELIFAIVIIAITVLSLPMMSRITSKGAQNSIVQEAIFAAATELNEILTQHWDVSSLDSATNNAYAKVIDISGRCDDNTSSPRYRLMPGHINQPLHRRCTDSNVTTPSYATSATIETIRNKKHGYRLIFLNPTPDKEGYKDKYKSKVTIQEEAKFGGTRTKNIQRVKVTITNSKNHVITSLKAYVANIGETDYYKKAY
jgi:prepilin-type N-terminal cleavage/methylation domain-containing protein